MGDHWVSPRYSSGSGGQSEWPSGNSYDRGPWDRQRNETAGPSRPHHSWSSPRQNRPYPEQSASFANRGGRSDHHHSPGGQRGRGRGSGRARGGSIRSRGASTRPPTGPRAEAPRRPPAPTPISVAPPVRQEDYQPNELMARAPKLSKSKANAPPTLAPTKPVPKPVRGGGSFRSSKPVKTSFNSRPSKPSPKSSTPTSDSTSKVSESPTKKASESKTKALLPWETAPIMSANGKEDEASDDPPSQAKESKSAVGRAGSDVQPPRTASTTKSDKQKRKEMRRKEMRKEEKKKASEKKAKKAKKAAKQAKETSPEQTSGKGDPADRVSFPPRETIAPKPGKRKRPWQSADPPLAGIESEIEILGDLSDLENGEGKNEIIEVDDHPLDIQDHPMDTQDQSIEEVEITTPPLPPSKPPEKVETREKENSDDEDTPLSVLQRHMADSIKGGPDNLTRPAIGTGLGQELVFEERDTSRSTPPSSEISFEPRGSEEPRRSKSPLAPSIGDQPMFRAIDPLLFSQAAASMTPKWSRLITLQCQGSPSSLGLLAASPRGKFAIRTLEGSPSPCELHQEAATVEDVRGISTHVAAIASSSTEQIGEGASQVSLVFAESPSKTAVGGKAAACAIHLRPRPHYAGASAVAPFLPISDALTMVTGGTEGAVFAWSYSAEAGAHTNRLHAGLHRGPVVSIETLPKVDVVISGSKEPNRAGSHLVAFDGRETKMVQSWKSSDTIAHLTRTSHSKVVDLSLLRSDYDQHKLYDVRCSTASRPVLSYGWSSSYPLPFLGRPWFHRHTCYQGCPDGKMRVWDLRKPRDVLCEETVTEDGSPLTDTVWTGGQGRGEGEVVCLSHSAGFRMKMY